MIQAKKVLIVEDEDVITNILSTILTTHDYRVIAARTGEQALIMVASHSPDLILLDLGLPGIDGMEVIKNIRQWNNTPILVVSARDMEGEKVQALDLGADDYITKPFGSSELLARIRTALRHYSNLQDKNRSEQQRYSVGGLCIDFERHIVEVDGELIHLTPIEFKIVALLAQQPGKVMTYNYMMEQIWGPYLNESNKILRVNMANIRRKIERNPAEPQYIITEVGIGYRMVEEL